jgi:predicted small lipoprotein YifL
MKKELLKIAGTLLLVISLTACGQGGTPTAPPATTAPEVVALPTAQPGNPCANEYFPIKENATYNYSSAGSPSGPYTFTRTISNVREKVFSMQTQYKNQNIIQKWECKPKGLTPTDLGATDAASMLAFDKFANLSATNVTGIVLPTAITPGSKWNYALDIQGTEKTTQGTPATMTGHVTIDYVAGNKESVTVPAGTFDAVAIQVTTAINFNVVTGSGTVKLSVDSTYTLWYAPGVGWVKASGNGKLGGQEYVETIVLESYTIP